MNEGERRPKDPPTATAQAKYDASPGEAHAGIKPATTYSGSAAPVSANERIRSIDVLRGVALMGVLLMNMQAFAMPLCAYMNPTSYGNDDPLNMVVWSINYVLADSKFITIFSMLFGAGIVLMTSRAEARAGRSLAVHYRRMLWLAVFGAIHGILLWHGDILLTYSICGLLAYWFRRRRPWLLITVGLVLFVIPFWLLLNFRAFIDSLPPEDLQKMLNMWAPSVETLTAQVAAYRGGYLDHLPERFESWTEMIGFLMIFGWRILGMMLLGMASFKLGVLSAARSKTLYVTFVVIGFACGLPLAAFGIYYMITHGWDLVDSMGAGMLFNYVGSLFAALAWIGVVMLLCQSDRLPRLKRRFAAVGQMAFTNYIMHSVLCTMIFYGHGLGLFGRVGRVGQLGVFAGVAALQLWYSAPWLERFRFGPLEWLWRTLTYWRIQPFRRALSG